jgi:hypothetical protein
VSSLSDERVIKLINRHFIPSWFSRDHYQLGPMPPEEKAEITRLDGRRASHHMPGGNVCVFLIDADGDVLATLPVGSASNPDKLIAFLNAAIDTYKFGVRSPEAARAAAGKPVPTRPKAADGRLFSIYTRFDDSGRGRGTSHDSVELSRAEWSAFVPRDPVREGDSWSPPAAVSAKLLKYGYPPLPHWWDGDSKVREAKLTFTVVSVSPTEVKLRIRGRLELVFPDTGKPTDGVATAQLVGAARVDPESRTLKSLHLTSEKGDYVWHWEGKPIPRTMVLGIEME